MILDWPDCTNVRDLGGLTTGDGRRVRPDALLRSDSLHRLTEPAVAAVRAGGIRRILDLRWQAECVMRPSPFESDPLYRHTPLLGDDDYVITLDQLRDGPDWDSAHQAHAAHYLNLAVSVERG
ncbi:tyrosine-protein phosphatase, partial [Asanoa sp. NPDC050611]|uniref:tyrosine-protein phosphatase n=1 Tax=Asanoa sp. NPDC050611 TaxID=3157098 RepID=UPI0033EF3A20